jgi:hypothetical protein
MAAAETENTPSTLPAELHSVLRGPQATALETASKMPGPGLSAVTSEMVMKEARRKWSWAWMKEGWNEGRIYRAGFKLV